MFFIQEPKKRAIAYYRHSAEDKQENSVAIQREHAHKFAQENNIEIIHEEADEGKSGLSANRPGFDKLFKEWILNPNTQVFDYVLVYDVSRWGRFQDQDEAAFWEFRCKNYGKQVIYVSRGFPKEEQQLISSLQTSIERYMAAEYSRNLSEKVFYGSIKVSEQGFSAGGTAPYGMQRVLLNETKKPISILKPGEHKVIANQRVIFAPADDQTTETVKTIFSLFVKQQYPQSKIANLLNKKKIPSSNGLWWNRDKIIRILTNETYIGTRIYNKTWTRLKQKQRPNPRSEWVICPNAFEPIIDQVTFSKAQERLYWNNPLKWKRGDYISHKIQKQFREYLRELLKRKLKMDEDSLWSILRNFPIIIGSKFYCSDTIPRWCFTIRESMKQYEYVLSVAIDISTSNHLDRFFLVPTSNFGLGNFLTLGEQHPQYSKYIISQELLEEKIGELCKSIFSSRFSEDKFGQS